MSTTDDYEEVRAFLDAFYKRGEELRAGFGQWDGCDPVAHALLDLVQAQNNVAQAIRDDVDYGVPNVIKPAMDARAEAAVKLIRAVIATTGWPERLEANDASAAPYAALRTAGITVVVAYGLEARAISKVEAFRWQDVRRERRRLAAERRARRTKSAAL